MRARPSLFSVIPRWIRTGFALAGLAVLPMLPAAASTPLQTKDIGQMLRGGYTSAEVLQEVETRHVVDSLDAATEKTLRDDGADERLIEALKSGRYTLAPADSAAVKRQQEQAAARLASDREAGQDRLLAQARQNAVAAVSQHMANLLRNKLVICKDGQLQPYDENILTTKKVFAFYYSASWCAPGRQFTTSLIKFYQQFVAAHPAFEVVYLSDDRSPEEMADYMKTSGMPWPALEYSRIRQEPVLTPYEGPVIPSLALLDGAGGLRSYSSEGTNYLGPRHVILDLAKMAGIQLTGDMHDPPPVSAVQPPVSAGVGRTVSLSGQPE
jgi:thiol-disulfide isomerase/thioredoxin